MRPWRRPLLLGLTLAGLLPAAASASRGTLVSRSPFGLSIEYPTLESALGRGSCPGAPLLDMLRRLGSPSLRIGGDSQDLAGPGLRNRYVIEPVFWRRLGCLARQTGAPITVGLNLGDGTLAEEREMVASATKAIPASQLSFSLGNEPDLYVVSHVLPNEPSFTVPAYRPPSWSSEEYLAEWSRRRAALGPIALEGPDLAGSRWNGRLMALLSSHPPAVLDAHAYPTSACHKGPAANAAHLLGVDASVGLAAKLGWLVAAARRMHRPAIVSEANSASCGGQPGISDTPVAAVWGARFVIAALLDGLDQVRFHSAGVSYDPFVFGAGGTVTVRPLGRALVFLHRWIPLGSRVSPAARDPLLLAMRVSRGGRRTLLISSFATAPLRVSVTVANAGAPLAVQSLTLAHAAPRQTVVTVSGHRATLWLAPNEVVAIPHVASDGGLRVLRR